MPQLGPYSMIFVFMFSFMFIVLGFVFLSEMKFLKSLSGVEFLLDYSVFLSNSLSKVLNF